MGALAYADDVVIMALTIHSFRSLIICDDFGSEYEVVFSSSKYQLLHYSINRKAIENIIHNTKRYLVLNVSLLRFIWATL